MMHDWLTLTQAAELLGTERSTVREFYLGCGYTWHEGRICWPLLRLAWDHRED